MSKSNAAMAEAIDPLDNMPGAATPATVAQFEAPAIQAHRAAYARSEGRLTVTAAWDALTAQARSCRGYLEQARAWRFAGDVMRAFGALENGERATLHAYDTFAGGSEAHRCATGYALPGGEVRLAT